MCWIPCYLHGSSLWCSSFSLIFVMILNRLQLFPAMWWQIMILYLHSFNLRSPGRWLHSLRPADAVWCYNYPSTGSDWTDGNINDDTRGKEPLLWDRFVSTRTPNFQLDQSDENSRFLSTCLYYYFIATVSYRHYYSFSLLQRAALQKQILHLSPMTRRASR